MPELDPIKVKVVVEYDPAGLDKAKEDLAKLSDIGGSSGDAIGGLTDNLATLDEQAASSAESAKSFNAAIEELPKIAEEGGTSVADMTGAVDEHTAAVEEATTAHEDLQSTVADTTDVLQKATPAMQSVTKETQAMSEQVGAVSENMSVFQDALVTPEPYQMVSSYLNETGQTWGDFASSIGDSNLSILRSNDAFRSDVQSMGDLFPVYSSNAADYSSFVRDMSTSVEGATGQVGGFNEVIAASGKQMDLAGEAALRSARGINELGGVGAGFYGPETAASSWLSGEASSIFGGGGLMAMLGDFMMPMFAIQMIGMGVQQLGQGIYNAAAIAEGPAAHGVGTFTGAVDVLNQSVQKSGQSFSENFGRGVLPTLDAINNATAQNSGGFDFWGNLGRGFGMEVGLGAGFIDLMTGNLSGAGAHGLANYYANFTGQPEPYPSPAPPSQADTYYQQQMANLPNTIQMSGAQLRAQGTIMLAQAADPTWEADYNQYTADQRATQYLVQQYQSRHPISMQQAIMNAQYEDYAAQQNLLAQQYDTSGGASGSVLGGPSKGIDFGGFFSKGFGADLMQFFGGTGGIGGGQTYGQAIWGGISNLFGGMGAGIGNLFNFLGSGGAPSSSVGGGCFVAGTRVLLANGDTKPIETLQTGEEVRTHDGAQRITACMTYPAKQSYELVFSDGTTLLTTDSHPIATINGWKSISPASTKRENPDLSVDRLVIWDIVQTVNGPRELLSIQKRAIVQVYNITIANTHTYYANGVLVHNKFAEVGQQTADQIAGIQLPHIDLSGISSQLAGAFGGITMPHIDLSGISGALSGAFSGLTMPQIPDIGGMINGALGGMFGGISMPQIPDIGSMINGALGGMFGGISLPQIPDIGSMLSGALGGVFSGFSLPSIPDIGSMLNGAMSGIFSGISLPSIPDLGSMINSAMSGMFSGISLPSVPNIAGSINSMLSGMLSGISVPFFASGVENFGGGLAVVGDAGPELVSLPSGSSVYPMSAGSGVSGGNVSPISLGGGGGNMPQSLNLTLQLGNIITSQMIPLAQDMRLVAGIRGY